MDVPSFVSVSDYLRLPRDHEVWLLKNLLPAGGCGIIYAPPKIGKTYIALQMADAIAGGQDSWMEFDVIKRGRVLFLQLDTPRTTFAPRFEAMRVNGGLRFNDDLVKVADNETLQLTLVDVIQPAHRNLLAQMIKPWDPVLVIVDTLRKVHTGDENSSTVMSNVMSILKSIVHPSALLVISHERKPSPDSDKDIMNDLRGSTSVVGEMDGIMRLTHSRLYYAGRNIEPDSVKLTKQDVEGCLMWAPDAEENKGAIATVLMDSSLPTLRAKARALARLIGKSEDACMSKLRRRVGSLVDNR